MAALLFASVKEMHDVYCWSAHFICVACYMDNSMVTNKYFYGYTYII